MQKRTWRLNYNITTAHRNDPVQACYEKCVSVCLLTKSPNQCSHSVGFSAETPPTIHPPYPCALLAKTWKGTLQAITRAPPRLHHAKRVVRVYDYVGSSVLMLAQLRPASMCDVVFQRGVRADEAAPGSGLGLAIVRDLVELYQGTFALEDFPMGGLRARLRLPK